MRNFHFTTALLPDGWADDVVIAVEDGVIVDMSVGAPCPPFTDRLAGVAIPGVANLHSHAHQRAMAGLTQRSGEGADSFWTWREAMYRAVQAITPDDLQVIATHAYVEMLAAGYTHVAEFHYLHHAADGTPYANPAEMSHRLIAAARAAGIGLTLLPVLYAASGFDGAPPHAGQRRFASDLDGYAAIRAALPAAGAGLNFGIAPHSLRAVPGAVLSEALAAWPDGPVHIHVAEQQREVDECLAHTGRRPVAWLLDHAPVNRRWCLVHATHVDADEIQAMAHRDATVGLCPTTEADLGDGVFPAEAFLAAGGRFGVGSDAQVSASPFEELRLLEWGQRLVTQRRTVLAGGPGRSTGRALFDVACGGGAEACGIAAGRIEIGMRADVVVLSPGLPGDARLDEVIFAGRGSPVRHVVAGGECIIRDGAHRLQSIAAESFRRVVDRLAVAA
jgi:formimidoylglutamate deiminase